MPRSARRTRIVAGALVSAAIFALIVSVLLLIASAPHERGADWPDILHLLRMSALQAGLSTLASILAGMCLAWALSRLRFFGRAIIVAGLSAAIVTPAIVVAVGVVGVWGRSGWVNTLLTFFGLHGPSPFGLGAIIYAHTVLNAPFAAAVLLARLEGIAPVRLKLGQSLRLPPVKRVLHLDLPAVAPALPGLAAVIFLLAFTSFPVVLLLGGGPANQTFETAIYAAVKLDFDLGRAAWLAAVQLVLTGIVIAPAVLSTPAFTHTTTPSGYFWPEAGPFRWLASALLIVGALSLGLPLLDVLVDGWAVPQLFGSAWFWRAAWTSLWLATASALLTLVLALIVATARISTASRGVAAALGFPAFAYLALPGVTLALGLFLAARNLGFAGTGAAPIVVLLANALLSLPFAIATLSPALATIARRTDRLATNLRVTGWQRLIMLEWPLMGREVGLVLAMGFGFSLGDLSAISLFGTQDFSTLPWAMHRALGAYRTHDAAAIAAILLVFSFALFFVLPKLMERLARASAQ